MNNVSYTLLFIASGLFPLSPLLAEETAVPEVESSAATTAAEAIAHWAIQPQIGPEGRPLPLISSWDRWSVLFKDVPEGNAPRAWNPDHYLELLKQGFHVLPTFGDPHFLAKFDTYTKDGVVRTDRLEALVELYRPLLEYAHDHKLPIGFVGNNFEDQVRGLAMHKTDWAGRPPEPETDPRLLQEGGLLRGAPDALAPDDGWVEYGKFWFGHHAMKRFQEIYPDPPMVLFFSNNEGAKIQAASLDEKSVRYMRKYGDKPLSDEAKKLLVKERMDHFYGVLFKSAREALVAPAWKKNVRFIAYNETSGDMYLGKSRALWPADGYPVPATWDGTLPEYYDNDWQPGKTDYMAESPQIEAMNLAVMQGPLFEKAPDFFWGSIFWEGSNPGDFWRPRGLPGVTSKTNLYAVGRRQVWDFDRLQGLQQFGLWMMRPRLMMEFRGGHSYRNAWENATWESLLTAGQRPWVDPVLREFWEKGRLVPNDVEKPRHKLGDDQPEWVRKLDRWFLLTCDVNPARTAVPEESKSAEPMAQPIPTDEIIAKLDPEADLWKDNSIIKVFAFALELGKSPERRWLVFAHAPVAAIGPVKTQLPGYGEITLDVVPPSGSFFVVSEKDRSVSAHLRGSPGHAIVLQADKPRIEPGGTVQFSVESAAPADDPIVKTEWTFEEGEPVQQKAPATLSRSFKKPGQHIVTATGTTASGAKVVGQAVVSVGPEPDKRLVYDLPLSEALQSGGPWSTMGADGLGIAMYRHLPTGTAVVVEGEFVADPERGRVLELKKDRFVESGVYLHPNNLTTRDEKGYRSRTISFSFKADDTERRQVLYADGGDQRGVNIYLADSQLRAGAWNDVEPYTWKGTWLDGGTVKAGEWVDVSLVFPFGSPKEGKDQMQLYVNGKLAASGPFRMLAPSFAPPRLGVAGRLPGNVGRRSGPFTRFHDDGKTEDGFTGRLSDFQFLNAAKPPGS